MVSLFYSSIISQIDTIPTQFYGVAENESYTYISANTGLYILERDSNNFFGEFYNVNEYLGVLHIHINYLISAQDKRLKIFNIAEPSNPNLMLDTLLAYPILEFDPFDDFFIMTLKINPNHYVCKFIMADVSEDGFEVKLDSDLTNPSLSGYKVGSEFHYPYAFLCFDSWIDTLRTYRYNYSNNEFIRIAKNFYYENFITSAGYNNLLFTAYSYYDYYGNNKYAQLKYSIDTVSNTFTYIGGWGIFGVGPSLVNSFAIYSHEHTYIRNHNYSPYKKNISGGIGYPNKYFLTDNNVFWVNETASLYYSSRITTDSIIYKLIDFNPTNFKEFNAELNEFNLSQNYPNPFNSTTKITYSIPQTSNVVIKVFDILGNEIETLVSEEKQTGTYEITWYAEGLPSGVYFYRLQAGSFVETKKMILLK